MKTPFIFRLIFFGLISTLIVTNSCKKNSPESTDPEDFETDTTYIVSLSGNSHITIPNSGYPEIIHQTRGLINWTNNETTISTYFKVPENGKLKIALNAKNIELGASSKVKVTINGDSKTVQIADTALKTYDVGKFDVSKGYVKVDLSGISKTGTYFAEVPELLISVPSTLKNIIYCNNKSFYQQSRLGPINYFRFIGETLTDPDLYYYFELNVPTEPSLIKPFTISTDFEFGSIDLQPISNSTANFKLRISDPSPAMDPGLFPIDLLRKGDNVVVSGIGKMDATASLQYNWNPSNTYKFLLKAQYDLKGGTDFTVWFFPPEENKWKLLAAFKRPVTKISGIGYILGILKNDNIAFGYAERNVSYLNQWLMTNKGNWHKITSATYKTYDDLVTKKQRVDAYGGTIQAGVFLKNGGYFNETLKSDVLFNIENNEIQPAIDINSLP